MKTRALALALLLGACGSPPPPGSPQEFCARQADNDPAYKDDLAKAAGTLDWQWQNQGRIEAARQSAMKRCLAGAGGTVRGGVERVR